MLQYKTPQDSMENGKENVFIKKNIIAIEKSKMTEIVVEKMTVRKQKKTKGALATKKSNVVLFNLTI